ncbi:hypothetical protein TNCV_4617761 [Trichonephila clavipes]|nr:hypothetical protein TNCV_4617761 [Trichonephila clavipes]
MQEKMTDRRGRSHPPRYTTSGGQPDWSHSSDGLRSHVMSHSTTDSVCYASFGVRSNHPTPFATEWNVCKASFLHLPLTGNHRH